MLHRILFILLTLMASWVNAEMVVIAHPESPVETLSKKQVIDLYMGKVRHLPNGERVRPLDHPDSSTEREEFYHTLTGKSVAQVNAYWARLIFVGRATPPKTVDSSTELIEVVSSNPDKIGYIRKDELVTGVKVIAHVE